MWRETMNNAVLHFSALMDKEGDKGNDTGNMRGRFTDINA
jgi:hypothetical protein